MTTTTEPVPGRHPAWYPGLATIVGFLACVEFTSGILQGYYTPMFSDIARHLSHPRRRRELVRGGAADASPRWSCRCSPGSAT